MSLYLHTDTFSCILDLQCEGNIEKGTHDFGVISRFAGVAICELGGVVPYASLRGWFSIRVDAEYS